MIKTFSEFTKEEQKIICEKNKDYMLYDLWYYDVAHDMPELIPLGDFVLDWVADDDTCGILGITEYEKDGKVYSDGDDDFCILSDLERILNDKIHEYYDYWTDPEHASQGLMENNELIDTETYKVV